MDIKNIAYELNERSSNYNIGQLQKIRKRLKNRTRLAGNLIFDGLTIDDDWAFHYGGRSELQFNIGREVIDKIDCLRFGVAFSLEPSRTLPDISLLFPKIKRFNEFMRLYPDDFPGFHSWCWDKFRGEISSEKIIQPKNVRRGAFLFFGKYIKKENYSFEIVLRTFDLLLPLYEYVEGSEIAEPLRNSDKASFLFKANIFQNFQAANYSQAEKVIDLQFRHSLIQFALFKRLCTQYGAHNVATEISSGIGNRVDVILRHEDEYWFYEVKTGGTARACIREAMGQLFEYSYWPGAQIATRLIIVGEPVFDNDASLYISKIRDEFSVPVYYEQQCIFEI